MKDKRAIHLQLWKQALERLSEVLAKSVDDHLRMLDRAARFDSQLSNPLNP